MGVSRSEPSLMGSGLGIWYLDFFPGVDDDTKMAAALTAWAASSFGGTIILSARSHTMTAPWQPMASSFGGARFAQPFLRITGAGAGYNVLSGDPSGGTTVNFTYNGAAPAKIDTRGTGTIEIDHIFFKDSSGQNLPFFQTTNTTPKIHDCAFQGSKIGAACDQDAIILGGNTTNLDGSATAAFQGYGGFVRDNYFDKIRRWVYGQVYCNGMLIVNNAGSTRCGADATAAAIEFAGASSNYCSGNIVVHNVVECVAYVYGLKANNAVDNIFGPNGFYDPTSGFLACYAFSDTGGFNLVTDGYRNDTKPFISETPLSFYENTVITSHQSQRSLFPQPARFTGGLEVYSAGGSGAAAINGGGDKAYWIVNQAATPNPSAQVAVVPSTQFTDGATTSGSNVYTSASAVFTSADEGVPFKSTNIPSGTFIVKRLSASTVQLSQNATATGSGLTFNFGRPGTTLTMTKFERHHIVSTGNAPSGAVDTAAGSGATVSITGTDMAGEIVLTTGTLPTAGQLCHWAAASNWTAIPRYAITARDATTAALLAGGFHFAGSVASSAKFSTLLAPAPSTTYTFDYLAIQ